MMKQRAVWLIACAAWLLSAGLPAKTAAQVRTDEPLLAELRALLLQRGLAEVVLQGVTTPGIEVFGYNFDTGAWYEYHAGTASAKLETGEMYVPYTDDPGRGEAAKVLGLSGFLEDLLIPTIGFAKLLSAPRGIQSISRRDTGEFTVTLIAPWASPLRDEDEITPESARNWTYTIETGADGFPVRTVRHLAKPHVTEHHRIGFLDGGLPICAVGPNEWTLVAAVLSPPGTKSITRELVDEMVTQARVDSAVAIREKLARKSTRVDPGPGNAEPSIAVQPSGVSRASKPLILTGVLLLIGAVVIWVRSK